MRVKNTELKILVSDKEINFNKEEIEALVYYSSGDVQITSNIDGKKEEINLVNINMTNIRLFLANWIAIKNSDEKIVQLFVLFKNMKALKDTNNMVNISKVIAESDIGLISFNNYDEFATTLIQDQDIDNTMLLETGMISIDRTKLKSFLSNKIEKSQAPSWSDSKILQTFSDSIEQFIKVNTPALADYIDNTFYLFKSATTYYIINKLDI